MKTTHVKTTDVPFDGSWYNALRKMQKWSEVLMTKAMLTGCVGLATAFIAGCIPNVTWLPDSSGFFYTSSGPDEKVETLNRFDVRERKSAVLVRDTKPGMMGTFAPGLNAKGDQLALMRIIEKERIHWIELPIYNTSGRLVRTSKPLNAGTLPSVSGGQTAWSPSGDAILATCGARSWIYSLIDDRWVALDGFAVTFGHTPLSPDGKRFLICKVKDDTDGAPDVYNSQFWSGDWQGRKQPIAFSIKQFVRHFDPDEKEELLHLSALLFPSFLDSSWTENRAEVRWKAKLMTWHLDKKHLQLHELKPPPPKSELDACHRFRFPKTDVLVRSIPETADAGAKQLEQPFARVEIVQEGKQPKVIVRAVQYCTFTPSPDRRHLAIHTASRLYVIDETGVVIGNLELVPLNEWGPR